MRGCVGRAPGQATETRWRQAHPLKRDTPGRSTAQRQCRRLITPTPERLRLSASVCSPPVGTARKKSSGAELYHARQNAPAAVGFKSSLVAVTHVSIAHLLGRSRHWRPSASRSTRNGAFARPSHVRDRARQGRNGKAGSSEADEPGPKGDAKLPCSGLEKPNTRQVVRSMDELELPNPISWTRRIAAFGPSLTWRASAFGWSNFADFKADDWTRLIHGHS